MRYLSWKLKGNFNKTKYKRGYLCGLEILFCNP